MASRPTWAPTCCSLLGDVVKASESGGGERTGVLEDDDDDDGEASPAADDAVESARDGEAIGHEVDADGLTPRNSKWGMSRASQTDWTYELRMGSVGPTIAWHPLDRSLQTVGPRHEESYKDFPKTNHIFIKLITRVTRHK
jgi:hypothetical protein